MSRLKIGLIVLGLLLLILAGTQIWKYTRPAPGGPAAGATPSPGGPSPEAMQKAAEKEKANGGWAKPEGTASEATDPAPAPVGGAAT